MAIHKLHLDEFDQVDYDLLAIHTALEDYRLAYYLNQKLPVRLQKSKNDIPVSVKQGDTWFSHFIFENPESETTWSLIPNKNEVTRQQASATQNLFGEGPMEVTSKVYLLPEFKKVDYFLKIENAPSPLADITKHIHAIARISAVYPVDLQQIKSKNNLIF